MLIGIVAITLYLHESRCSVVIDSLSQKGPYLSQYCPKSDHCEEGTHVMCMYYNPNRVMGPRCSNPQNITMTPDVAANLLEVSNAVRSRIALGKEVGKNGPLPRGYGIFRLSWDEELATFAQVLANQCVLTRDLCRATLKFPDPGQATGLVRFTYPDWLPVSNRSHFTTANLTAAKLNYAITQTMKTWYGQKNYVTSEMIGNYPDFQNQRSQFGKLYLKMIYGPATHMGCGISAYTQFAYYDNNSPLNYNVVCNYSAKPRASGQVYTTTPPTQTGFTVHCGCPEGFDEDLDCLCFESRKQPPTNSVKSQNYCSDDSCKQSVVLLPIFTIEDAPPHKLLPSVLHNKSRRIETSDEIFHLNRSYKMNVQPLEPQSLDEFTNILKDSDISRWTQRSNFPLTQHRYTDRKPTNKKYVARESIFSRVPKFKLPTRKVLDSYRIAGKEIKKDVAPRKDFSAVQKLLKSYLNKKRNHAGSTIKGKNYEYTSNEPHKPKEIDVHITGNSLVKKSKVVNPNRFLNAHHRQDFVYGDINTTKEIKEFIMAPTTEYSDKKLMDLLNNLETEVSRIELNPSDKKILDTRIRKIYDTVVRKNNNYLTPKLVLMNGKRRDKEDEMLINYEKAADKEFINKEKIINEGPDDYKINLYDDTGFVKRNQNSIRNSNYRNALTKYKPDGINNIQYDAAFDTTDDDHLSYDRRKYYQDKLDHLQRKLQEIRAGHPGSINTPRHVLPVRPATGSSKETQTGVGRNTRLDTFFIPDRARFIHGF